MTGALGRQCVGVRGSVSAIEKQRGLDGFRRERLLKKSPCNRVPAVMGDWELALGITNWAFIPLSVVPPPISPSSLSPSLQS